MGSSPNAHSTIGYTCERKNEAGESLTRLPAPTESLTRRPPDER